jgi:hypothetical protein
MCYAPRNLPFRRGDGSSFAKAIVVKAPTDHAGVDAQHDYIAKHFGKWRSIGVKSVERNKRLFDIMSFTTADGKKYTLYFDITDYYGKLLATPNHPCSATVALQARCVAAD